MKPAETPTPVPIDAPLAVTSDGRVLFNVLHVVNDADLGEALRAVMQDGHQVFVGIAVPDHLAAEVRRDLDDAAADIVGRLGVRVMRRQRRR